MNNCKVRWPWPHCSEQTSDLLGQSHSSELFTARLKHSLSVGFNSFLLVCRTDNPFGSGFSAACQNSSRLCVQLSQCPSGRTDVTVNELSATLVAAFWVYLPSPLTHPLSDLSGCAASVLLAGRRQLQTAGGLQSGACAACLGATARLCVRRVGWSRRLGDPRRSCSSTGQGVFSGRATKTSPCRFHVERGELCACRGEVSCGFCCELCLFRAE